MSSAESNEIVTFVVFKCAMSTVLHVMVGEKVPKKKKGKNILSLLTSNITKVAIAS